jgi:hypothetical protein
MSTQVSAYPTLSIPRSLIVVGIVTGSIGVLETVLATIAYAAVGEHSAGICVVEEVYNCRTARW